MDSFRLVDAQKNRRHTTELLLGRGVLRSAILDVSSPCLRLLFLFAPSRFEGIFPKSKASLGIIGRPQGHFPGPLRIGWCKTVQRPPHSAVQLHILLSSFDEAAKAPLCFSTSSKDRYGGFLHLHSFFVLLIAKAPHGSLLSIHSISDTRQVWALLLSSHAGDSWAVFERTHDLPIIV